MRLSELAARIEALTASNGQLNRDLLAHKDALAQASELEAENAHLKAQLAIAREGLEKIILAVEDEAYKVTAGQPKCRHIDALNEIHESAAQALAQMEQADGRQ